MPNVQIPPGLSESDDVQHDQTEGGTEGNPHSSSASTNHGNGSHSANFETDSGAQSRVNSHENKNNPHSSSASTNHGNESHSVNFFDANDYNPENDTHSRYSDNEARNAVDGSNVSIDGDAGSVGGIGASEIVSGSTARSLSAVLRR